MASFPYMQFQRYNPMDTLLKTAMGTYEGLGQGKQRRLQSEMLEQQIPFQSQLLEQQLRSGELGNMELENRLKYAPQLSEAQLALIGAQTQNQAQDAAKNKQILEMMQNYLGGGQGSFGSRMASPVMQGNGMIGDVGPYPGPSAQEIYARKYAGLPELTPEEETAIKLWENMQMKSQEKNLEKNLGTSSFITDLQSQNLGIENSIPILDKLIENEAPMQLNLRAPNILGGYNFNIAGSPSKNAKYEANTSILTDKLVAALGLPKSNESLHLVETIVKKQNFENEEQYKERLRDLKSELIDTQNRLSGNLGKSPKQHSIRNSELSITDPDVVFTAQKHGITPQEVINRLSRGNK